MTRVLAGVRAAGERPAPERWGLGTGMTSRPMREPRSPWLFPHLPPPWQLPLTRGTCRISAGKDHVCAMSTSGGLKCWGKGAGEHPPAAARLAVRSALAARA
eukprot:1561078-Rhodomonas_salina.2